MALLLGKLCLLFMQLLHCQHLSMPTPSITCGSNYLCASQHVCMLVMQACIINRSTLGVPVCQWNSHSICYVHGDWSSRAVVHKGTRVQHLEHTGFGLALFCVQDRRTTPWPGDCMEVNVVLRQAHQQVGGKSEASKANEGQVLTSRC